MVHQSIKVYARIRKGSTLQSERYDLVRKEKYEDLIFSNNVNSSSTNPGFRFHKVFNTNTNQEEIFETVAKPVLCSVIEGFNGTLFAYGQTGSGKTYSINGSSKNYSDRGIIPRCIQYVFDHYSNIPEKPTIYISYMEIYNEIGYDLLSTKQLNVAKTLEELPRVFLMEDKKGDAHIRNLSVFPVTTEEEAMRLLFMGDTNRTIAETPYNEYSSRSHCIFTLYITHRSSNSKNLRSSKLHLVDLAGSERVYKSNCTGVILHEAKFINLSLHFLQQVILALSEAKRSHIPYRNSMLTHLLKDSLNGNCITTMLATLSINKENLQETVSTCRFAQRVSLISTDPIINEITDPQQEIDMLRNRIHELEAELAKSTDFSNSATLNSKQKENCQFEINSFINSDKKTVVIESDITQIQFCFNLLKKELVKKKNELQNVESQVAKKNFEVTTLKEEINRRTKEIEKLKTLIDRIPEKPVPLNSPNRSSLSCSTFLNQLCKGHDLSLKLYEVNAFEEFTPKPEVSEDMTFYKNALENKLNLAKLYAEAIEECKVKITSIRNKLIDRKCSGEKKELVKELEMQQTLYKQVLSELKQIQNETIHLEAGLKRAEIRALQKLKSCFDNNDLTSPNSNYYSTENIENSEYGAFQKTLDNQKLRESKIYNSPISEHLNQPIGRDFQVKSTNFYNKFTKISPEKLEQKPSHLEEKSSEYVTRYMKKIVCDDDFNKQVQKKALEFLDMSHNLKPPEMTLVPKLPNKLESSEKEISNPKEDIVAQRENEKIYKENTEISHLKEHSYLEYLRKSFPSYKVADVIIQNNFEESDDVNSKDCLSSTSVPEQLDDHEEDVTETLNNYIDPFQEPKVDNSDSENDFSEYFKESDTADFKDFMKTVTLSGVAEIDEEIVSFYRSKLC